MTRRWLWYTLDFLFGLAILLGAIALTWAEPPQLLGMTCRGDQRVVCPSGECADGCALDVLEPIAWGTDPRLCGDLRECAFQFGDKADQIRRVVPVGPCAVECGR